jgi:lysophospholipase L1-like esterase
LWRVQNGELPVNLRPSVYWVLIGTNDIGNTWCAPENVVVGILRVVEEILSKKPLAQVVLNALLPRSFNQEGYVAKIGKFKPSVWEDIKAINKELKMYATYRDRVVFFETNVFLKDPKAPKADLQIDEELMPDFLHPSAKGYQLWGEEIAQKLEEIIPRKM